MSKENLSIVSRSVSAVTSVTVKEMRSKSQEQNKVFARMILAYVCQGFYNVPQKDIALFLLCTQPAISHYIKTAQQEINANKEFSMSYQKVLLKLSTSKKAKSTGVKIPKIDPYIGFPETCEKKLGIKPVKELRFHPKRMWRFDFAFPEEKVAVEVEGGVWSSQHGGKSRHFTGTGAIADMEKYSNAAALGWRILRFTPQALMKEETLELIKTTVYYGREKNNVETGS